MVKTEIAIMKKLQHPNVVDLKEVLNDPQLPKLYLVMEYVCGGCLLKKIASYQGKPLPPLKVWNYFRDLICGLFFLHENAKVVHRDIKPENLLLDEKDVLKISDFGISHILETDNENIKSNAGSALYMPPEAIEGNKSQGKPLDIWASGVTLFFMVFN